MLEGVGSPLAPLVQGAESTPGPSSATPSSADRKSFAAQLSRVQAQPTSRATSTQLVAPQRTQLSGSEAAQALSNAWTERFGQPPTQSTLAVLTAQWAHETGRGASMMNFNFGGIKGTGPSGLSVAHQTREGYGTAERRIVDHFRAYESASEGAADYLSLLTRRYPEAIAAAQQSDAVGFVQSLADRGYFTGDLQAYARSVERLSHQAYTEGFDAIGSSGDARMEERQTVTESVPPRNELGALHLLPEAHSTVSSRWNTLQFQDEMSRLELLWSALEPTQRSGG